MSITEDLMDFGSVRGKDQMEPDSLVFHFASVRPGMSSAALS